MTPLEVFDLIRDKAQLMLETTFMESEKPYPSDEGTQQFMRTLLGIGIAAASEHYAENPEHIAIAGAPVCTVCREPVQTLQLGIDPAQQEESTTMVKIAWPCGHLQT